jgi:hypothetical protein
MCVCVCVCCGLVNLTAFNLGLTAHSIECGRHFFFNPIDGTRLVEVSHIKGFSSFFIEFTTLSSERNAYSRVSAILQVCCLAPGLH